MTDDPADGDSLLTYVGIGLVLAILIGTGVVAMAIAGGPSTDSPVDVSWTLERTNDSYAKIVHGGGEPVAAENIVVTVDSYERQTTNPDFLVEGDTIVFEARPDQIIRLYWDEGRGKGTLLGSWRPERT